LFRKRTEEERRYYEITAPRRWLMATTYFGLIGALVFGMHVSHLQLLERVDAARQKYQQTFPQIKIKGVVLESGRTGSELSLFAISRAFA
jgi:hypothetical protein